MISVSGGDTELNQAVLFHLENHGFFGHLAGALTCRSNLGYLRLFLPKLAC